MTNDASTTALGRTGPAGPVRADGASARYGSGARSIAIAILCGAIGLAGAATGDSVARPPRADGDLPLAPSRSATETAAYDDPIADGWASESFQARAASTLRTWIDAASPGATPELREAGRRVAVDDMRCSELRPAAPESAFRDRGIAVFRDHAERDTVFEGRTACDEALARLLAPFAGHDAREVDVHVYRVEPIDRERVTTRVHLEFFGEAAGDRGARQIETDWVVTWTGAAIGEPTVRPSLESVRLAGFLEAVREGGPWFTDATGAVFGGTGIYEERLARGLDAWWGRYEAALGLDANGYHGVAVGDVDGDGREDLYVAQSGGLPNLLLIQEADGTVRDRARVANVDLLDRTRGVLLVDLDGDVDPDLVIATSSALFVMENVDGVFRPAWGSADARNVYSVAAADYDRDGDLDLYATRYHADDGVAAGLPVAIPYHDAENGGTNFLFRNDGAWAFADATAAVGLDANNTRFSFAASWEDYDDDGDVDLYVANDFGRNNLYRNDGGRFGDVAAEAGVEDLSAGMSASWADYDRDGRFDLYVGNMFSNAGNRVAYRPRFQSGAPASVREGYRRHARGNSMFRNLGDGTFRDVSEELDVTRARWAYGSVFADVNDDGSDDLLVANGYVTQEDTGDL